ncbi:MAG: NlpC/P60 family protein [Pseudomonadales bacterium]|nr:NlpC/P60 family protein [Pseudomonadales bacterium]
MQFSPFSRLLKNLSMLLLALVLVGCASQSQKTPTQTVVTGVQPSHPLQQVEKKLLGYFSDWQGTPYRLGGNSRKGIDCSTFVKNAYQSVFAVKVPHTTLGLAAIGKSVKKTELVPGDLVLFKTSRSVRHVGVVVNGNKFMHVSEKKGVMISALDNIYWRKKYWKAVRPANGITL